MAPRDLKKIALLLLCLSCAGLTGCAVEEAKPATVQEVLSLLLQGDARDALRMMDAVDPATLTPPRREAFECIRARFGGAMPGNHLPPAAAATLSAYQGYWRALMLKREEPAQAEAALLASLNAIPELAGAPDPASIDSVTNHVVPAMQALGLHALTGKTQPLYELMLWKGEETSFYDVKLPEESVRVKVVFLEDFASTGWSGFATCGVAQTGGWAKPDALYAVRSSYDLSSEEFRVSYLAHEGQHFADYARYPHLEQPELEYRAKLTEVTLSRDTTAALLARFASQGAGDRAVPHAYANRQVSLALAGVPLELVREAAARKLRESSATLERLGPATATRFLE